MTSPASIVIPSHDPADAGSLAGTLRTVLRKYSQDLHGQLPALVISYDRVSNTAMVQPLVNTVNTAGKVVPRAQIAKVPVLALGGGGFCLTFPLKKGDVGWIEASDRDISLFMQSLQSSRPNTFRMHSFEDARFVPDAFRQYTFDTTDDSAAAVLQSYDGTVKITLAPGVININATAVNVNATTFTVNGKSVLDGNVSSSGTFTNNGTNISSTHVHGGVTPGGSSTSTPA